MGGSIHTQLVPWHYLKPRLSQTLLGRFHAPTITHPNVNERRCCRSKRAPNRALMFASNEADKIFVTSAKPKSHSVERRVPHAWDTGQRPVQPERWWRVQQRPSSTTVSSLFSPLERTSMRLPCPRWHKRAPGSIVSTEHGQPGTMSEEQPLDTFHF